MGEGDARFGVRPLSPNLSPTRGREGFYTVLSILRSYKLTLSMYSQIDSNKRKTVLLIAIFVAVIMLAGFAFSQLTDAGYGGLAFAGVFSIVMALGGYYGGDKVALLTAGAKGPIAKTDNPYLYRLVENLTITAGLPLPKIYLITDPVINAFACGRNP